MNLMNFGKEDSKETEDGVQHESQSWDNPKNPEGASDKRDLEQLERQKKEAERRRESLSEESKEELNGSKIKAESKN